MERNQASLACKWLRQRAEASVHVLSRVEYVMTADELRAERRIKNLREGASLVAQW